MPVDLKKLRELEGKATAGPWAWEQYGEKENCYSIGVAFDKHDNQVGGRVESEVYDEDADVFVETLLWKSNIGQQEGATVNYDDAEFITATRNDLLELLDELEKLRDGCRNLCPDCAERLTVRAANKRGSR